jgi:hypothetical protein
LAITEYCNKIPSEIREHLRRTRGASAFQDEIKTLKSTLNVYNLKHNPKQVIARLYGYFCKQLAQLYIAAERWQLNKLKKTTMIYFRRCISLAWDHSDVLSVVELVLSTTGGIKEGDPLSLWLLQQVEARSVLLLREPQFLAFIPRVPKLQELCGGPLVKKYADTAYLKQKGNKALRYCYYADWEDGDYCHINMPTTLSKAGRKCTVCKTTRYLSPARMRMWPEKGEAEPEPEPAPKKKLVRKRKRVVQPSSSTQNSSSHIGTQNSGLDMDTGMGVTLGGSGSQ